MWLKYRPVFAILFLEIMLLCDAEKRQENKRIKTALDLTNNSTANRLKLSNVNGRFLNTHNPITCDGYILTIFRLTREKNKLPLKNPVLLVHGMYQSSDRWLQESNTQKSLAFKLQDLGYDVWLFNARGNKYSRQHMYLSSECDEKWEYFEYSFEEIGLMDIAATVNYILNVTSYKKINYVGHSMGGTEFLILNSLKPEYNNLFETAFLLAPLGYQRYFPHATLKWILKNELKYMPAQFEKDRIAEVFPYRCTKEEFKFTPEECLGSYSKYRDICKHMLFQEIMDLKSDINTKYNTRGGSVKQLLHLAQNVDSTLFRRYMYSTNEENMKHYGVTTPPEYYLSEVTVPTTIYYSMNDEFVHHTDIKEIANKIAHGTRREVAVKDFKHNDFVNSADAMFFVYDGIIKSLPGYHPAQNKPEHSDESPAENLTSTSSTSKVTWIVLAVVGAGLSLCLFIVVIIKCRTTN